MSVTNLAHDSTLYVLEYCKPSWTPQSASWICNLTIFNTVHAQYCIGLIIIRIIYSPAQLEYLSVTNRTAPRIPTGVERSEPKMASANIESSQNGTQNGTESSHIVVPLIINGQEEIGPVTFDVVSPYTNKTCWTATSATPKDAVRAVEAAEAAFPAWSKTKPAVRRDILLRAADILESRIEGNSEIMRTEMGADVGASLFFVAPLAIRMLRDIAGRITSICGSVPVVEEEGQSAIVYKEPMGVILGIVPWYIVRTALYGPRMLTQ
jgi:hypothetical protein